MDADRNVIALASGTMLERYRILNVLGAGGFGITYLAEEIAINRKVAIKEYLPSDFATRARDRRTVTPLDAARAEGFAWGLKRFIDEARTLARFEHPNIVTVFTFFEANATAYYVMRYVEGEPLDRVVPLGTTIGDALLRAIVNPLLDGIEAVHNAGFLHRDIKPGNIFIRADGLPILIDFGAARFALGERSKTLTAVISPGYAPFEQYHSDGNQGPWTDIYALGATLYRCVTGQTPIEATLRFHASARNRPDPLVSTADGASGQYDSAILMAIDSALKINEEQRPQSVAEFRACVASATGLDSLTQSSGQQNPKPATGLRSARASGSTLVTGEPAEQRKSSQVPPKVSRGTDILIQARDGFFSGYRALARSGKGPGIVLIQEIFGVNRVMRDIADWLAGEGYTVICPDLFWRQEPGVQLNEYTQVEWDKAFALYTGFSEAKGVEDIQATTTFLRQDAACNGPVGAIGYCLGGKLAYLAATRTDADCSVGYYGIGIEVALNEASNIKKPLMLHFGKLDAFVPPDARAQIHRALDGHGKVSLFDYERCAHAFARVGGDHYNPAAAELAHSRTLAFFKRHLVPKRD